MANTESRIRILFDGVARGVVAAAAEARAAIKGVADDNDKLEKSFSTLDKGVDKVSSGLLNIGKGIAVLGAAGASVQVIGGVAGAVAQLAPAALLLPGALLGGAAAMGTLAIATAGVGDALKAGLSGDMEKFAKATKDMAPAMLDAVKAVVAFKPQIDDLKRTVQGNFWGQFSGDITKLGGTYLPILKTGLGNIATQMGVVAKGAIQAAQTPFFQGAIARILDNTASFMRELGSAAGDALTGFVGLGAVGSRFLPQIAEAVGGVVLKFREWVEQNSQVGGTIDRLISGAIQGFKDLGGIVKNVGSILVSVFTGLGGTVSSPLASLRELTGQLAAFLKTAEAQEGLRALGDVLQTCAQIMRDVLLAALKELAPLLVDLAPAAKAVAQGFGDFAQALIAVAGPALRAVAQFLSQHADLLRLLTPLVISAVIAYKGFKVLTSIVGWASDAKKALVTLNATSLVTQARAAGLVGALGKIAGVVGIALVANEIDKINVAAAGGEQNLTGFAENLHDIVGAGKELLSGNFSGIFADINTELSQVNQTWSQGQAPVQQWASAVGTAISDAATSIGTFLSELPGQIVSGLSTLGGIISSAIGTAWQSFVDTTRTKLDEAVAAVQQLPDKIGTALGDLTTSLGQKATETWDAFRTAAGAKFDEIVGDVRTLPGRIAFEIGFLIGSAAKWATDTWQAFKTSAAAKFTEIVADVQALPGKITTAVGSLVSGLAQKATEAWQSFKSAATAKGNEIESDARALPGKIASAISSLASALAQKATEAWQGFLNAARTKANEIVAAARALPGQIASTLSALAGQLTAKANEAWQGFLNGCRAGAASAVAFVRGVPAMISGAIGNLGGVLVSAGRSIIDGLTSGMRSALGAALSFVRDMGAQIVAGARAALRIGSPSKAFRDDVGIPIMQGLQLGIAKGLGDVLALASSAAGQLTDAFTVSPQVQLATSGGGLNVAPRNATADAWQQQLLAQQQPPVVDVKFYVDGEEFRGMTRTEIDRSNRSTRRVVGMGAGTTF